MTVRSMRYTEDAPEGEVSVEEVHIEGLPASSGAQGPKGDPGPAGPAGAAGVGVKSVALTVDASGKVTGGTLTKTDGTTSAITVTTATA